MRFLRRRSAPASPDAPEVHTWQFHGGLSPEHRARLVECGVRPTVLDELDLREVGGEFPAWWHEHGNALYLASNLPFPQPRLADVAHHQVSDCLVVLAAKARNASALNLHGDAATVFIGPKTWIPHAEIDCGADSSIVLNGDLTGTARAVLDARNGGRIVAAPDQLWASDVLLSTDDMHRLEDAATGARLNGFGGRIELGQHIWIGRDAVITGRVTLGDDCVVGMRSLVRNRSFEPGTAIAGTPARAIRTGITWAREDSAG